MQLTVKQVADAVGFPSRTVRYYDRIGLVCPAERSTAGYRLYDAEDEGKLRFVRQAKSLGFTLDEIRQLVAAAQNGCCGSVVPELERLLHDKVDEIDDRIRRLQTFRQRLVDYADGRAGGCACSSHGAFCGCLNDVPMPHTHTPDQGSHIMTNQKTTTAASAAPDKPTGETGTSGCGCGPSCGCSPAEDGQGGRGTGCGCTTASAPDADR